jgi:hypothetical protein
VKFLRKNGVANSGSPADGAQREVRFGGRQLFTCRQAQAEANIKPR